MKKTTLLKVAFAMVLSTSTMFGQEYFTKKLFGQTKEYEKIDGKEIIRCASTEYNDLLKSKNPSKNDADFEGWLAGKIKESNHKSGNQRQTNVVITIPVVVHVLHTGQAVGTGSNISDLQVQSQITVLNQDYRRMLNTNGYNSDANGADVEVEFCLVQQTPTGLSTNGINRVNIRDLGITANYYNESDIEGNLKPNTIWDPTKYMNIWVGDFYSRTSSDLYQVLGYAQFPVRSGLDGLDQDDSPNTDGVIIDYRCFGSSQYATGSYITNFDLGRTTTHEVGHYLGLRHVNGDNTSCIVDATDSYNDFCLDTPAQTTLRYNCTTQYDSCPNDPGLDNFTNYMDYPRDVCLNKFTNDQKARIRAVLLNSPRRKSLATSGACTARPSNISKDGALKVSLTANDCNQYFTASVDLINTGNVAITNALIEYLINGTVVSTYTFTGNINVNGTQNIPLSIPYRSFGENEVLFRLASVNGSVDDNSFNNTALLYIFSSVNVTSNQALLLFFSDGFLQEMSYNVVDNLGTVIANGTLPATDRNSSQQVVLNNLVTGRCYTVTLTDSDGDGLMGWPVYFLTPPYQSDADILKIIYPLTSVTQFKFTKSATLGAEDFNSISSFGVYPNPANSVLNISIGNESLPKAYTIFNTLGQVVKSKGIYATSDLSINIEDLAAGIYMIKVDAVKGSQTIKFIKK